MKWLCNLDFHRWKHHNDNFSRTCKRCKQYQIKWGNVQLTVYGLQYIWNWCNFPTWKD